MKLISRFILIGLVLTTVSACSISANDIIKPEATITLESTETQTKDTIGSQTEDSTDAKDSVPIGEQTTTEEQSKPEPEKTSPEETKPVETTPVETTPVETTPSTTETYTAAIDTKEETKPAQENIIKSNIPSEFQVELSQADNGVIIVYRPDLYSEIKAITKWDIVEFNTGTQLFLVTKEKGSRVEVSKSKLTEDEEIVIPGEVIRHWETTSDYEVIRILYSDPETMPFNFIRVIEPSGEKTTLPIHTSMRGNPEWETFQHDTN